MKKALGIILVITISLSFLVISIEANTYNTKYYLDSYEKYNIVVDTSRPMEDLEIITEKLILYLKDKGGEELLNPHYNEREILHMEDVQTLFKIARIIKYACLGISILLISYFIKKRQYRSLKSNLTIGLFSNHIILFLITILATSNFNKYFTYFHLIFFNNDLWLLDPNTDLLIQMLPEAFFVGIAIRIVLSFLVYLSIIQISIYFFMRKDKDKHGKNYKKNKDILT